MDARLKLLDLMILLASAKLERDIQLLDDNIDFTIRLADQIIGRG